MMRRRRVEECWMFALEYDGTKKILDWREGKREEGEEIYRMVASSFLAGHHDPAAMRLFPPGETAGRWLEFCFVLFLAGIDGVT